ncbi:SDR family oxidoreductase [Scytonema sp. UIC 10036]|uniref:SDR family oxidoreductase n=1 Tax=Scytonema sp. UIC 10036 TaxID=2304196 RepID=UPI0012DAE8E5|nr:SDR family oxidoreductase [Scytonema sp. UIC 10036]MUG93737.1 SDR family oxidoreductase [Scytonema sp. UIC 10036]
MTQHRREIIKSAALTATGMVLGTMSPLKSQEAPAQKQTNARPQEGTSRLLVGKVALVTGAARGIGRAIAIDFAKNGANVALLDIADPTGGMPISGYRLANESELDETVAAVRALGVKALKLKVDVRNNNAMKEAAALTARELGGLDIAVANAGIAIWTTIEGSNEQQWRDTIDVNINGVFNTIQAVVPHMKARQGGRIITISSIGGRQGVVGNGAYGTTKWAVIGLTKSAAIEFGASNITVNSIAPGPVNTPLYRSQGQLRSTGVKSFEEQDKVVGAMLPLKAKPALDPQDIADTATFLASDHARFISGEVIDVALGYNTIYTA